MDDPALTAPLTDDPKHPAAHARELSAEGERQIEEHAWAAAEVTLRAALAEWRALGRAPDVGRTLMQLGLAVWMQHADTGAVDLFRESAAVYAAAGDGEGEGQAWYEVAAAEARLGRWTEADATGLRAAACFQAAGQPSGVARAGAFRARVLWRLHRPAEAEAALEQAIATLMAADLDGLPDGESLDGLRQQLARLRVGIFPEAIRGTILPADEVEDLIQNTLAVMTVAQDRRDEWRGVVANARADAERRGLGWQVEVQLFEVLLAMMDGQPADLPPDHPYAPALATIRAGIAAGGPPEMPVDREVVEAVRAFVATEDWTSAQRLVEARQAVLLRPEVDMLFDRNIAEARSKDDRRGARVLTLHRDVLRACRAEGIEAGFAWLRGSLAEADARAEAARQHDALPPDMVERAVAAFLGTPDEKLALYSYLQGLAAFDHSLAPLARALQQALFEEEPAAFGDQLTGGHSEVWRQIMARIRRSDAPGRGLVE
jgi:hypothetical protein